MRATLRRLGLFLTEDFALMSYASIIEPYRAANALARRELYRWAHVSADGRPVRASNGAAVAADQSIAQPIACDTLFVFAGGDPARFGDPATFAWLRRVARAGVTIVGVSGGPFLLARAGLLEGHRATIHWDHQAAFAQAFPTIPIEPGLYVVDRRRVTCAGGIAGLDLAIELIEREQGHDLAVQVGDWFIRAEPRAADRPQRVSLRERYGITSDRVLRVLAQMEAAVEEPLPRPALARAAGVSVRQLERLFADHLGETVAAAYLRIRLDQARLLLRKTGMAVTAIAIESGFRSASHFTRAYRRRFGATPTRDRADDSNA